MHDILNICNIFSLFSFLGTEKFWSPYYVSFSRKRLSNSAEILGTRRKMIVEDTYLPDKGTLQNFSPLTRMKKC